MKDPFPKWTREVLGSDLKGIHRVLRLLKLKIARTTESH